MQGIYTIYRADGVGRYKLVEAKVPAVDGATEIEAVQTRALRLLVEVLKEIIGGG